MLKGLENPRGVGGGGAVPGHKDLSSRRGMWVLQRPRHCLSRESGIQSSSVPKQQPRVVGAAAISQPAPGATFSVSFKPAKEEF